MVKSSKIYLIRLLSFLVIEAILFVLVFSTHGLINKISSFLCVVVPFLFSLTFISKDFDTIYTQIALFCTVMADLFLVVLEPQIRGVAMTFFFITQLCYALRTLRFYNKKIVFIIVYVFAVVLVITTTIIVLKNKTDYLSIISMLYYTFLVCNVIFSCIKFKYSPLLAVGLILFICCDTLIGLKMAIGTYIDINPSSFLYIISHTTFNLAWLFYIPSQTLLALSVYRKK